MRNYTYFVIHVLVLFLLDLRYCATESTVNIGVVLDLNSPMGSMLDLSIRMAVSDFYLAHPNFTTRLQLHTKNAKSMFDASFAVIDLLKDGEIRAIFGPEKQTENAFVAELGEKVHVPIISFAPRSSAFPNPYFLRATPDDSLQAQAFAALCKGYNWSEVVVLYEDTDNGNQFLSHLNKVFKEVEVRLAYVTPIPTFVEDYQIRKELKRLTTKQTRVFLVHMNPSLGNKLFTIAKELEAMSVDYAWLISDSLFNFMSSMDSVAREPMEGVLGLRPYIHQSKKLKNFQQRWKRKMVLEKTTGLTMELNVYGLWAYDAVTALAYAVEKIGPINSTSLRTNHTNLRISTVGPELLTEISRTQFLGLTGDFQLFNGTLNQTVFEIFNVYGSGEKTVGFWSSDRGLIRELSSVGERTYSTSTKNLKTVVWPGDSTIRPKGWAIPPTGILRVGVPWKYGFTEFAHATVDSATNRTNATGFAVDIFLAALQVLPFPVNHEFRVYNKSSLDWSYDDMLHEIPECFDMAIGDLTIWAPRAGYVDFSLPFSESGVVLVVKNKKQVDMWIFTKPLSWDLWLAIVVACVLMGIVLHILERRVPGNGEGQMINVANKEKLRTIYWSPVTFLAFPERNMVSNNWSFLVLVFWMFMAFILMQSYTANLSAILTVDQLKFAFSDSYRVGYLEGSFMRDFLTKQLHINESRLISFGSAEGYHNAMSLGSNKTGGIDAIFDEVPYMKIFLNKYDSQYKMVGPTYRTGGFGFAFPVGSPLTSHFSKAILNVTQGSNMTNIEKQNFGPGYSSQNPLSSTISQGASSLTLHDFAGLFLIIGSVTLFSLFCSETPIGRKITGVISRFIHMCSNFKTSKVDSTGDGVSEDFAEPGEENDGSVQSNMSDSPPREGINDNIIGDASVHNDTEIHETDSSDEALPSRDVKR